MYIIVIVLTVLVAIAMIGIVLIQKSKGGGLSSQFGGGNQVLGVRGTNTFLEKATWTLAALILILSIASAYTMPKPQGAKRRAHHRQRGSGSRNSRQHLCHRGRERRREPRCHRSRFDGRLIRSGQAHHFPTHHGHMSEAAHPPL